MKNNIKNFKDKLIIYKNNIKNFNKKFTISIIVSLFFMILLFSYYRYSLISDSKNKNISNVHITNSINSLFINTNLEKIQINKKNSYISLIELKKYKDNKSNYNIIRNKSSYIGSYIIYKNKKIFFNFLEYKYLKNGNVKIIFQTKNDLFIKKILIFHKNSYLINFYYFADNIANNKHYLLKTFLKDKKKIIHNTLTNFSTYSGISFLDYNSKYRKINFENIRKNFDNSSHWIAYQEPYFLKAFIPQNNAKYTIYTKNYNNFIYTGIIFPQYKNFISYKIYAGPLLEDKIGKVAYHLDYTLDYGYFYYISKYIFYILKFINSFTHNWGISIIFITILIKLMFYKLAKKSHVSMQKMKNIMPEIQIIKKKYKDDKKKIKEETFNIYKKYNINPLSSFLPLLVQIPFFIGLYYVLSSSVELRKAHFIFWIKDLSSKDPLYILPIIMGITMYFQQIGANPSNKIKSYTKEEKIQSLLSKITPFIFIFLFINFPSGLILYWITNNIFSIIQQYLIKQSID